MCRGSAATYTAWINGNRVIYGGLAANPSC
jgi:hypothetical protein